MGHPVCLVRLKKRSQFLALARKGHKAVRPTMVVQSLSLTRDEETKARSLARQTHNPAHNSTHPCAQPFAYVGFTASKKVGNAVARNRAKRRLTAAARQHLPHLANPGQALVLIARGAAINAPFAQIENDLKTAMGRLKGGVA